MPALQVYQLALRHALVRRHYGRALKLMMKQAEDKPGKELDVEVIEVSVIKEILCKHLSIHF